jgi:hypothetical protein
MAIIEHILRANADQLLSTMDAVHDSLGEYDEGVERNDKSSKKFTKTTVALGAALVATTAIVAKGIAKQIAYGDQLGKMSERTGIAVEQLSTLKRAAENSDSSLESLARGVSKLSKGMFDAATKGTGPAAEALDALGISATDSSGRLRSSEAVLAEVSDAFASMENGTNKAALAVKLFGGAGEELIPFLNQGAAGLKENARISEDLGLIWSDDASQAAEDFGDAISDLRRVGDGFFGQAAQYYIPVMADLAKGAVLAARAFLTLGRSQVDADAEARDSARAAIEAQAAKIDLLREEAAAAEAAGEAIQGSAEMQDLLFAKADRLNTEADRQVEILKKLRGELGAEAGILVESAKALEMNATSRAQHATVAEDSADRMVKADREAAKAAAERARAEERAGKERKRHLKRINDDVLAEQKKANDEYWQQQQQHHEEIIAAEQAAAEQRVEIERTLSGLLISIASSVADGLISALRKLTVERSKDAKTRREREIGLAILMGEIQAGLAFGSTLAQIGGTPQGYAAAAAAAAAVGVATKVSAAVGAADSKPYMHDGGMVDELDIRARAGEAVLSPAGVRALGGADAVNRANSSQGAGMGSGTFHLVQKLDHRVLDVQIARAIQRTGSPLDAGLRAANPVATARRNPYLTRS